MEHLQMVHEAAQAIQHVVNAFNFFRNDNPLLNDLLENIESMLKFNSKIDVTRGTQIQGNSDGDVDAKEIPIEPRHFLTVNVPSSRKRIRKSIDENDDNNYNYNKIGVEWAHMSLSNTNCESVQNSNIESSGTQHLLKLQQVEDSSKQSDPPEKTAEERVFGIDLLLEYILSAVSTSDLKSCRCINPTWNLTATKILHRKDGFNAKFIYNTESKTFETTNAANCIMDIVQFSNMITKHNYYYNIITENPSGSSSYTNSNSPFINYSFLAGNLNNPILQSFLKNYGSTIKKLEIELYRDSDNHNIDVDHDPSNQFEILADFKRLLTNYLPNIQVLKIGDFPPLWHEVGDLSQLFPEPQKRNSSFNKIEPQKGVLSKLQSLHFFTTPPLKIFNDLLAISTARTTTTTRNKVVQSIGLTGTGTGSSSTKCDVILSSLVDSQKLYLLKCFELSLQPENLVFYENFVQNNNSGGETQGLPPRAFLPLTKLILNLEHLSTEPEYWIRVAQVISKFLKMTSPTLEELHTQPLGDCLGLEIPQLRKLKKLRTLKWNIKHRHDKLFPDGVKFSEIFPNLEIFESSIDYYAFQYPDMEWDYIFGASKYDELGTVRELNFTCGPPAEWMVNFCEMFPNLEYVRCGITEDFPRSVSSLWKLAKLETLAIIVNLNEDDENNAYPAIDAGFTGFSKDTCIQLYMSSRDVELNSLNALRENSSILDAKCLRRLNVSIHESSVDDREGETFPVVSHVTGLFAFQMCPLLHVTLGYSVGATEKNLKMLKNGLSSILPYVDEFQEGRCPYDNYLP